jgi:hypothetical protein
MRPSFISRLFDPEVRTIMLCGCGGGFDFVHGMLLVPELLRRGKKLVIGSYSFGDPEEISAAATFHREDGVLVKQVTAASVPDPHYGPEIHLCSFLDQRYPDLSPASIYAYYARAFTVPALSRLYQRLVDEHDVDAIVLIDGGSDSLMAGDEEGLGDPIEDAVSVAAVASLTAPKVKVLVSVGLGADRFNQVSDAASLRAVAELTASGGFLGAIALEPDQDGFGFYRDCLAHIYQRQEFRSVLAGAIEAAGQGHFGSERVPPSLTGRVGPGQVFLWPLMAMLWGFDVDRVAARSLIVEWIRDCETVFDCEMALGRGRRGLKLRPVEELPRHVDMRNRRR